MKKLLYSICFLLTISLFVSLTQISCQKVVAQLNIQDQHGPLNLILLGVIERQEIKTPTGEIESLGRQLLNTTYTSNQTYLVMDLDGSNLRKIPISLPSGLFVWSGGRLSPDGKLIVFSVIDKMGGGPASEVKSYIYSCALDGSGLKKLRDGAYSINGVY
jgi:hypothetical protein